MKDDRDRMSENSNQQLKGADKMKTGRRMTTALAMLAGIVWAGTVQAGDLTPPGAPGPTMRTLTEIYDVVDVLQQQVTDLQQELNTIKQRQGAAGFAETVGGMVLIPEGPFRMGDAFGEGGSAELPVHEVTVSAFYMDQYPVTKALWDEVQAYGTGQGYTDLPVGGARAPAIRCIRLTGMLPRNGPTRVANVMG